MLSLPAAYGPIFFLTLAFSAFLTGGLYYASRRTARLLPEIRDRDVHTVRKPRIGGTAMWVAVALALIVIAVLPGTASYLDFNRAHYLGLDVSLWGILGGMLVLLVMGWIDDVKGLGPGAQLLGQFLASLCLVGAGIGVSHVTSPFGGHIEFSSFWSGTFTVLWTMTLINVMNWFDGLDGLAGSVTVTASVVLLFLSIRLGFLSTATLAVILAAAAGGFLFWNWNPSKIFMGTVGSQTLGFLLAVIAVVSGGKLATATIVLGIPLFDAIIVVIRRLADGVSPFKADQRHLHHRLLKMGLSVPWAVIMVNAVSAVFGVLAYRAQQASAKGMLTVVLAVLMLSFIYLTYVFERARKRA